MYMNANKAPKPMQGHGRHVEEKATGAQQRASARNTPAARVQACSGVEGLVGRAGRGSQDTSGGDRASKQHQRKQQWRAKRQHDHDDRSENSKSPIGTGQTAHGRNTRIFEPFHSHTQFFKQYFSCMKKMWSERGANGAKRARRSAAEQPAERVRDERAKHFFHTTKILFEKLSVRMKRFE
jgi:hypothetical protein